MNDQQRVLHIVGEGFICGGIESFIINIYRHLDRTKVQLDFVAPMRFDCPVYEEEIASFGGRMFSWNIPKKTPQKYLLMYLRAYRFFKAYPYDIVHIHSGGFASFIIISMAAERAKIPVRIVHAHTTGFEAAAHFPKSILYQYFRNRIDHYATHYFACSEAAANWVFSSNTCHLNRIELIKNGIQAEDFSFNPDVRNLYRNHLGLSGKFVVGHIGRFSAEKNHEYLISVFYELYKKKQQSVLLLVGKGELEETIRMRVDELNLSSAVLFMGIRNDIPKLMQAMDTLLLPSTHEGLGIVLVEAQAAGLMCFASSGAVPNEAKLTNLLEFLPLSDPTQWLNSLLQLEDDYSRSDMSEWIQDAGYDIRSSTKKLEDLYLRLSNC